LNYYIARSWDPMSRAKYKNPKEEKKWANERHIQPADVIKEDKRFDVFLSEKLRRILS
jgi:hypothetical protein